MTAHVSPLPQVLLGSVTSPGGTNTQFPDGVSESTPFHVRSDRRPSLETSTLASDTSSTVGQPSARRGFRRRASILKKLAGPRENAKRLFRLGSLIHSAPSITPPSASSPPLPSPPSPPPPMTQTHSHRPVSELVLNPNDATMLTTSGLRVGRLRSHSSSTVSSSQPYPASAHSIPSSDPAVPFPPLRNEKIVATGSGISVGIALTEPVLYLQGYDQNDPSTKKSAILRGQLHLKITKSVKVKKISICFRGHAQTDWPDGNSSPSFIDHSYADRLTNCFVDRYPAQESSLSR